MGKLVNGKWMKDLSFKTDDTGKFSREESIFREKNSKKMEDFQPQSNRYHLYISHACPWAHRVMIMRHLKDLDDHIDVSVVSPDMLEHGWTFETNHPNTTGDKLYDLKYLYQIYQKADKNITTKVTVPILWDKQKETIINNESSEIIRIFNEKFNTLTKNQADYYPKSLQKEIDRFNSVIYDQVNNGVYLAGFATSQKAYEDAVSQIFSCLDTLDAHFKTNSHLVNNQLTEADIRLVTTLIRFDCVYHTHFKCNLKRIKDHTHLYHYLNKMRHIDAIQKTTFIDHIKRHYYFSHKNINPQQIIAKGPIEF